MHHVERGDHIKLPRQSFRDVAFFETHPVWYPGFACIRCRASNGRSKVVVPHITRLRKGLGEFDDTAPSPASHVSHIATALEKRFHVRHGRDPLLQQQIFKPGGGESFQPVPHHVVIVRLRNTAPIAKRCDDSIEYVRERGQHLIHAANKKRAVLMREHRGVFSR